ncbi:MULTISPECIES: hypothetical protein [unclassified Acinetobacter]|uniref:hypothetical protein n=1 Tax=unclassified Acinetobacter TaxID=196816 RepID=UPI00211F2D13|nr:MULTISPECIES: hypothetical protein [unclassified Acinetobacter]
MSLFSTGHEVVDQVGSCNFEGNILPVNWFNTFKLDNGKPDVNAVILLSEIVYWHRPTFVRDEDTGQIISVKKKFKADLLQRSYQSFSDQFGFSKQQVREALDRLEKFGVIKRHFRTIEANNQKYNNVLFIELITPVLFKVTTLSLSKEGGSPFQKAHPPHLKRETNTENTTEITTEREDAQKSGTSENKKSEENSVEHTLQIWTPNLDSLNSWLQRSGLPKINQNQAEEILLEINPHYENKIRTGAVSDTQMYSNFVKWVKRDSKRIEKLFEQTAQQAQLSTQEQTPPVFKGVKRTFKGMNND